jgi:anaerobic carbon-monoxide dehydrogenase, CODH/ACS complex subunit epsilon
MAGDDAWMRAEIGGTTRASVISKPEVVAALLKKATRPLFIIGHEVTQVEAEGESLIDFIKTISGIRQIPVLGTSSAAKYLITQGISITAIMGGMEIADRLIDPDWRGLDGEGQYNLVLLSGLPYPFCWTLLSGLRNGAPRLKSVTLDRKYQPHASWSFGNVALSPWQEQLRAVTVLLGKNHV